MTKLDEFVGIPRLKLKHLNSLTFIFLLVLLTLLRNGFSVYGTAWRNYNTAAQANFTGEISLRGKLLFVVNFFDWVGQKYGGLIFFLIMSILILFFLLLIEFEISYLDNLLKRKVWVLITLMPATAIILQRFGTFDTICIFASILGGLTNSKFRAFLYALIFVGTNPEGAIVAVACLLAYKFICDYKSIRSFLKNPQVIFSGVAFCVSTLIIALDHLTNSNSAIVQQILFTDSKKAFAQDLASGLLLPFSWFGCLWLLVVSRIFTFRKSDKLRIIVLIICIGAITMIASDGTRNAVLAFTSFLVVFIIKWNDFKLVRLLDSRWLIILYFVPVINVSNFNLFLPFHQILRLFGVATSILTT